MIKSVGLGVRNGKADMKAVKFTRHEAGAEDVELEMLYCGVCHSDIHQAHDDWGNTVWPCVPGHELVGRVSKIGAKVKNFKVGDIAAVGCMIDSCGKCPSCLNGEEQFCESETSCLLTYNGPKVPNGQNSYGGYSSKAVVKESFLLSIPKEISPEEAGPILCAGVTTYSPLKHWGVEKGTKVGIVGFGGLGHMGVQIAKAMGAEVTVITTSPEKTEDALSMGASRVIDSNDKNKMEEGAASLHLIINTIPYPYSLDPYMELLKRDGTMVIVGVLMEEPKWDPSKFIMQRRSLAGSLIGSIPETKEVLEFCAANNIRPRVEVIPAKDINGAFEKVINKKARYRYVLDLSTLPKEDDKNLESFGEVNHRIEGSSGQQEDQLQ
jgi:uncharacterized zinc-type alcohol dehydrogenase-like protein